MYIRQSKEDKHQTLRILLSRTWASGPSHDRISSFIKMLYKLYNENKIHIYQTVSIFNVMDILLSAV